MAHNVICLKCGKKFDRDKIQAVKVKGNRYGHSSCYPEIKELVPMETPEEEGIKELKEYIDKLFNGNANWALINKQIKNYKTEMNYSYSGMLKSLIYAYEIKKNDITKAKGVGIIPYTYKDAFNYYYSLWEANQKNENKTIELPVDKVIKILIPERQIKERKLFTFLDEEEV